MMNDTGTVIGVEHISELVEMSKVNISKSHSDKLENG
jgi:hypothetical protein